MWQRLNFFGHESDVRLKLKKPWSGRDCDGIPQLIPKLDQEAVGQSLASWFGLVVFDLI